MYKFPWSRTDVPGAWIEVTDICDLSCRGCYRHTLTGHAPLEKLKEEVLALEGIVNCSSIAIAGGEPLLYPHLLEIIEFIARRKLVVRLLTNGEKLTSEMARDLKRAGLSHIQFHVDAQQNRPGWQDKNESEMNELRQMYADRVRAIGGMQCGFHITVYRSSMEHIPSVVRWFRANMHKVQDLSLIAFRGLPATDDLRYMAGGKEIDIHRLRVTCSTPEDIAITSEEILQAIQSVYPDTLPSAYLSGTTTTDTYKCLVTPLIGTKEAVYGTIGPKAIEFTHALGHFFSGRYGAKAYYGPVGAIVFLLAFVDKETKRAFRQWFAACIKKPTRFFGSIYAQTLNIQQPTEILNGRVNLCDGCINQMIYNGKVIRSCQLDEYRMFGGPVQPMVVAAEPKHAQQSTPTSAAQGRSDS
jgi:hypothetical protein